MDENNRNRALKLRRTDLKISAILIVLCVLLIWETLSFPMTGSFGGVASHWFVSPALFPMTLLLILLVASSMLFIKVFKETPQKGFFRLDGWIGDLAKPINRERWYVILTLCIYIYLYIPSIDFFLATVLFLMTLCFRYYSDDPVLKSCMIFINALVVSYILLIRFLMSESFYFLSMDASFNEDMIAYSDLGVCLAIVTSLIVLLKSRNPINKKQHLVVASIVVPLFLVFSFNFILQVPMPVEYGGVIKSMEFVWYDVLNQ
ncbi:tripartite tricarboxylate transporter TctB family protein [Vibrio cyclitrophicus]|uniref:tripartite tricarboxylate transporter TctB family protein n=1 Tax=Vibrio cyclitrophicus TaxID=47951 RepID=UPI0011B68391|nr:tripartite tricarboxylate transporter TctB family protein [Vibrio cyclitrophicus]